MIALKTKAEYVAELEIEWAREKAACRDYKNFFKAAWPELEPSSPLRWNWHMEVICDELQTQAVRMAAGLKKEYDIVINIPPGSSKSTLVRRLFIPWVWTRFPGLKFITASFDKGLSLDHAVDSRTVIQSPWYQRHWKDVYKIRADQNNKGYFKNDKGGFCLAISVGSRSIGRRCDFMIIDDPNDPKKDEVAEQRLSVINWFTKTAYKRLNNAEYGQRVTVQQRTHENDLTGYLLANYPNDHKLYCIPGEVADNISPPELRRFYKDGLFDPVNYSRTTIADDKKKLGPDFYGQIMQRPTAAEGGRFKKHFWRFWRPIGCPPLREITVRVEENTHTCPCFELPERFEDKVISWDMGLKGKASNDPSAGHVWGKAGPNYYMLDRSSGNYDDLQMETAARALKKKHPDTSFELIEDAAAGPIIIRRMRQDTPGILGVDPKGTKENRAKEMARLAQSGNIYLPHPDLAPWVNEVVDQFAVFPRGDHDDDVDAATQAINHFLVNRRVFQDYDGSTRAFKVAWDELSTESKPIIVQYMERNGRSNILLALHNIKTNVLRVLGEAVVGNSNPESVVPAVNRLIDDAGAKYIGLKRFSWYGNNLMFAHGCGDVAETYLIKKIFIREADAYNDAGAIQRVVQRFNPANPKLVIHERSKQTAQEMHSWSYKESKDTKDQTEDGYFLARSVCLLAEVVATNTVSVSMPKKDLPYSKERTEYLDKIRKEITEKSYQ